MTPTRSPMFLRRFWFGVLLLAGGALGSGCGSDGSGSIHIESPRAHRETMITGAGVAPTAVVKASSSATPRKSIPPVPRLRTTPRRKVDRAL
jgi:hypothetical protein